MRVWSKAPQQGYLSLTFGMIGLVMCGVLAAPLVTRATTALRTQETSDPALRAGGAISATEHALWRIRNDSAFLDGMTGDPPSTSYSLALSSGDATVTVTQSSVEPQGTGIDVFLSFDPNLITPSTPSNVVFTLRVVNNGNSAESFERVEATPLLFSPAYVAGSTTGFTSVDPVYAGFGRWRWTIAPAVSVPPFGGEIEMSWQMTVNVAEGMYWTLASARVVGIGTEYAPLSSYIRASTMQSVDIQVSVDPANVSAGTLRTYTYTVEVLNNGIATATIDWLKLYTTDDFDYVVGSTSGFTTADPVIELDWINDRFEHEWNVSVPIPPGESRSLTMSAESELLPGTYYAQASVRVEEDTQSSSWESSAESGDTAPVWVTRGYEVEASIGGRQVNVTATLDGTGIRVISWAEE